MKQINILGIAPYEGLGDMMLESAKQYSDVKLDIVLGDMEEGVEQACQLQKEYDVILSRGGTAELIEKAVNIPVVSIEISGYDLLRVIHLAYNYTGKLAIAGFPGITSQANLVCNLLQFNAEVFTYESAEDVPTCIRHIRDQGYGLIIGDVVTVAEAKKLGINGILITSDKESVLKAIKTARKIYFNQLSAKRDITSLGLILQYAASHFHAYDEFGNLLYDSNPDIDLPSFGYLVPKILETGFLREICKYKNVNLNIEGQPISHKEAMFVLFEIKATTTSNSGFSAITICNPGERSHLSLDGLMANTPALNSVLNRARQISHTESSIWIEGEHGTGKATLAHAIYSESHLRTKPFIIMDCGNLDNRSWNFLTEKVESPLNDVGNTIFFKNIDLLVPGMQKEIEKYIQLTSLQKRNRLIFSSTVSVEELIKIGGLTNFSYKQLSLHELFLLPLREHKADIPNLASVCINKFNTQFGRQVIGFEEGALECLSNFPWPNNIDQIKKVLQELVLTTDASLISLKNVQSTLLTYGRNSTEIKSTVLDFSKTLEEIEKDIIMQILAQENFNQSLTAKRLGISRSTLWRKIRE